MVMQEVRENTTRRYIQKRTIMLTVITSCYLYYIRDVGKNQDILQKNLNFFKMPLKPAATRPKGRNLTERCHLPGGAWDCDVLRRRHGQCRTLAR